MDKKRNLIHIEVLRIAAAFFVIFNHTGDKGFFLFAAQPRGSGLYWLYLFISVSCKIAVPLFFMISGALLLKKDISPKQQWRKIGGMALVLLLFSAGWYLAGGTDAAHLSIQDFAGRLYKGHILLQYWYLYAYLAFLLALPFLRSMAKSLTAQNYIYLIALCVFFTGLLPCLEYRFFNSDLSIEGNLSSIWLFSNIVLYPLTGHFLENVFEMENFGRKYRIAAIFISLSGLIATCYMTYYRQGVTGECAEGVSQTFYNAFILLPCISIYLGAKQFFKVHTLPGYLRTAITSVGSCTFGIYLFHMGIKNSAPLHLLERAFTNSLHMNQMVLSFVICLITMLFGYIFTCILKKIMAVVLPFSVPI